MKIHSLTTMECIKCMWMCMNIYIYIGIHIPLFTLRNSQTWAFMFSFWPFRKRVFMLQSTPMLTDWCLSAFPIKTVMPTKTRLIEARITSCSWHLNGTKASSQKNFLNWEEQKSRLLFSLLQECMFIPTVSSDNSKYNIAIIVEVWNINSTKFTLRNCQFYPT